ncbi:MAG: methylmalonyl Co-A mutase-associated GTPase MeaB [Taibaiella sp.]|nr:methylmalonyl Co-A mutase-associated GTPase MeaB [Taibaiella sp.]
MKQLSGDIKHGSYLALAKGISIVENELPGYLELLTGLRENNTTPVIGITGPPGAGKSTLVNALLRHWLQQHKKIAVIAVDPSSPFNFGALLGDRIRMNAFYTNKNIYIRSLASRGALGGLSSKIIEITDLVKDSLFDLVVVETVGVGQSEVEVAGLADCTIVALVPEAGDEVQTLKAGIMEIADIFVVNKADRDNAEALYRNLRLMAHEKAGDEREIPVFKTVATDETGIAELAEEIENFVAAGNKITEKKIQLLAQKSWQLMQTRRMGGVSRYQLQKAITDALQAGGFNLYSFTLNFMRQVFDNTSS